MEKTNNKKNYIFYAVLIIAVTLCVMLSVYSINITNKLFNESTKVESEGYIEKIGEGDKVSQTFIAEYNNLKKITINFEPFKDKTYVGGKAIIGLKDENGNVIKERTITRNYIRENPNYDFTFPVQKDSINKKYELYISFADIDKSEQFYSVNYSYSTVDANRELKVNDKAITGTLAFQSFYQHQLKTNLYIAATTILAVLAIGISIYIHNSKDIKEEKIFLLTVPIIALMFMLSMPTFKNHDELYHWIRAYEVSCGHLVTPIEDGAQGSIMPASVTEIMKSDWTTIKYSDVKDTLSKRIDNNDTYRINSETAAVYSFVQYIPQSIGIFVARLFTNRTLLLTYAGRITNLLFAILILYFAIKKAPFGKKAFLVLSFIPIAMEGFSSLSPDAMTISMSFLYISYILHLAFDENIKYLDIKKKILLTGLSIIIALCKIVYIPLILLLFIIPKEKFVRELKEDDKSKEIAKNKFWNKANKKKLLNIVVIGGIAVICNLLWLLFARRYLANFREGDSKFQIILLLKNPIKYLAELIYTVNINGSNYLDGLLGEQLGWGELIRLNFIVPFSYLLLMIIEIVTDNSARNKFKPYQEFFVIITFLLIAALVFTSLYVQWTTIGSPSILGVQGRYLIPIMPLLLLGLGNCIKLKSEYEEKNIEKLIGIVALICNIIVILQIVACHI